MSGRIPLFCLYSFFLVGACLIRPLDLLFFDGYSKHDSIYYNASYYFSFASVIIVLFYTASCASYYLVRIIDKGPKCRRGHFHYSISNLGLVAVAILVMALLVFNIINLPNLPLHVLNARVDGRGVFFSIGLFKLIVNVLFMLFIFLYYYTEKSKLTGIGLLLAMVSCLYIGDRSMIVLPFIVVFLSHYYRGNVSNGLLLVCLGVVIFTITSLGVVRNLILYDIFELPNFSSTLSNGLNLIAYDQFVMYLQITNIEAVRFGEDFVNGFAAFIPRAVWPDKPALITPGAWLGYFIYGRADLGLPYTTPGLWFANFGVIGALMGGLFSGFLLAIFQNRIDLGSDVLFWVSIYAFAFLTGITSLSLSKALFGVVVPWVIFRTCVTKRQGIRP